MPLPPDLHVHTEWSWDAPGGQMERSCERALEIGLPGIAFTEHADWVTIHDGQHVLDIAGYHQAIERCQAKFKNLRILSGVELGEPHWFPDQTRAVLAAGPLDRVLGSIHCVRIAEDTVDASQFRQRPVDEQPGAIREFFRETLAMVESNEPFDTLAHLDYPKRYWPDDMQPYREEDYEEDIRAILVASVRRGLVLEANTTRGEPGKLCPGLTVLRWWREVGGEAVSFGSDAHRPDNVAGGFVLATQMVQAAGFKPSADPMSLWRK